MAEETSLEKKDSWKFGGTPNFSGMVLPITISLSLSLPHSHFNLFYSYTLTLPHFSMFVNRINFDRLHSFQILLLSLSPGHGSHPSRALSYNSAAWDCDHMTWAFFLSRFSDHLTAQRSQWWCNHIYLCVRGVRPACPCPPARPYDFLSLEFL